MPVMPLCRCVETAPVSAPCIDAIAVAGGACVPAVLARVLVSVDAEPTGKVCLTARLAIAHGQHGRCTVGTLNWVPKYLKTDAGSQLSNSIAANERRTALHEITHLLGFENPLTCACCCACKRC